MTALEHLEEKFLKQKLAQLEATFDAFSDDLDEHEAVIERLEDMPDSVGAEIGAVRRQLGFEDQS